MPAQKSNTVEAGGFQFDMGMEIPAATRSSGGATSDVTKRLMAMPVGASFLEGVTVPDHVKADERDAVFKDMARRTSNSISGSIRRLRKKDEYTTRQFVMRTVNDDVQGHGVRVWRSEDSEAAAS